MTKNLGFIGTVNPNFSGGCTVEHGDTLCSHCFGSGLSNFDSSMLDIAHKLVPGKGTYKWCIKAALLGYDGSRRQHREVFLGRNGWTDDLAKARFFKSTKEGVGHAVDLFSDVPHHTLRFIASRNSVIMKQVVCHILERDSMSMTGT